jgi:hypothetical protein
MPDWKQGSDYKFTQDLERDGWAWEFVRRNHEYRADYAQSLGGGVTYEPPKAYGESDDAWRARITLDGGHPRKMILSVALAHKWRMIPPIQNPNGSQKPRFDVQYPKRLTFDQLGQYFEDEESYRPRGNFAVLVFDLTGHLDSQVESTNKQLKRLQKGKSLVVRRSLSKKWETYLRLLDGEDDHAKPKVLRQHIDEYKLKKSDYGDKKKPTDRFSDHRKTARELRDNPLSILT